MESYFSLERQSRLRQRDIQLEFRQFRLAQLGRGALVNRTTIRYRLIHRLLDPFFSVERRTQASNRTAQASAESRTMVVGS